MATEQLQKTFFFFLFLEKSPLFSWFKKIIVYYRSVAIRWQIKSPLLICGFDFFFKIFFLGFFFFPVFHFFKAPHQRGGHKAKLYELFQKLWKSLRAIIKTLQGTKKLDYTFQFSSSKTQT